MASLGLVRMGRVDRPLKGLTASGSALRRVSAAWFLANLAEWGYVTALAIHEYRIHGALALGLIGARFATGALLGSLLLGALARRRPTLMLQLLSLGRCLVVGAAALAVGSHAPLVILVGIVWLDAVIAAPYRPLQAAILPALAGTPQELSAVAGSVPASKALAQAAGALAGSLALSVVSPQAVLAAAVGTFLIGSLLIAPVQTEAPALTAEQTAAIRRHRYGAIGTGFELIARRARPLLILGGTRSLTRGLWTSLTVVVSLRLLNLGSAGVGLLMAAAGIGAAVAVPVSMRFAGRGRLAGPGALSFALAGIPIVLVGLIARPAVAVPMIVLWGLAFSLADSISNALIHRVVEPPLLAPSVAALESSKQLLEGLGALAAPALLAVLGVRAALVVAGAPLPLLVAFSRPGLLAIDRRASNRARPLAALRRTPAFKGLTMLSLESLAARLCQAQATAGEVIIRQDELGDRFYLIDSGRVEVTIDGFKITELGIGRGFGEKALLRDTPRSATVTALEPTMMWYLDGPDFVAAATGNEGPAAQRLTRSGPRTFEEILAAVPLFAAIDRRELVALGEFSTARPGAPIVSEGEPGERFYVLLEGEALVTVGGRPVRTLVAGDSFGEIALLHRVPRTATVSAAGELALWSLERDVFLRLLGEPATVSGGLDRVPASAAGPKPAGLDLTGTDLAGPELAGAGQIV